MKKTLLVFGFTMLAFMGYSQSAAKIDYTKTVEAKTPAEKATVTPVTESVLAQTVTSTGTATMVKPGKKVDTTPFDPTLPKPSLNTANSPRKKDGK